MVLETCSRTFKAICTFHLKRKDTVMWGRLDESSAATRIISSLDVDGETIQRNLEKPRAKIVAVNAQCKASNKTY
jgi:hypothetical protein